MANDENIKKLSIKITLEQSLNYFRNNLKNVAYFSLVNYVLLFLGIEIIRPLGSFFPPQFAVGGIGVDVIGNVIFFIWAIVFYVFWCFFFRFYYDRKPYLLFKKIADSLVPSTKILFMTFIFATILVVLPYIPLFIGLPFDVIDRYTYFLKEYMQDTKLVDLGLNCLLILVSPVILYRPFMAWISALIGRSGQLKTALIRTKGNYWQFVAIIALFNFLLVAFERLSNWVPVPDIIYWFIASPIFVFFNIVIAKSYDFFFLDIDSNKE